MKKEIVSDDEVEEEEEPKPKKKETWIAQDIPTETTPMVVNTKDGKAYSQAVVNSIILNKLEKIEKAILE